MIDKNHRDDEFSDEGFDDEFSLDEENLDESHAETTPPAKKPSLSFSSLAVKKIVINLLMTAILVACTFSVYHFWSKAKFKSNISQKTALTAAKITHPSEAAIVSARKVAETPASETEKILAGKTSAALNKTETGEFSESEIAAAMKEDETSKGSEKTPEAQKGVFVFKNTTPSGTGSGATPATTSTAAGSTASTITTADQSKKAVTGQGVITQSDTEKALEIMGKNAGQNLGPETQESHEVKATSTPSNAASPSAISNMTAKTAETVAATHPMSPTAVEVQEMTQQINKTLDALSKLNQQTEGNLNQVKYLDAYTREVSLNVEKLNTQVATVDNRIQSLNNLANSLSKDLGKVRNEVGYAKRVAVAPEDNLDLLSPPPRRKADCNVVMEEGGDCSGGYAAPRKPARCAGPEEPEYVVHAVIPGRAWLKSCKGQILTVTEGETVGNYGKVLVIDASNSIVLTSSGIAFR